MVVIRRDLNTCSSQSTMHHGVPVRVFFRRSSEHHSRNDISSSTSWSHDSHVFSHSHTLVVPGTFLRVEHPSPCSFRKRVARNKKENLVYVPGTYISLFVLALVAGVNSNPSSRERFFLRTANPRGPKQLHTWLTRSVLPHTGDQARRIE